MNQLLGTAIVAGMASGASGVAANQRDEVIHAVNAALQAGVHTVDTGNTAGIEISRGRFKYTFEEGERVGCRSSEIAFDSYQGEIGGSLCLGAYTQTHELSYSAFENDNVELRVGAGVIEYDLTASASAHIFHPDIGIYSTGISDRVGDTLYDPFISASFHVGYPLGENLNGYGDIELTQGMYTRSATGEIGLTQELGNTTLYGALGINTFRVDDSDIRGGLANTLLGGDTGYVTLGGQHCFTPSICPGLDIRHGISGVGEGNTNIDAGIKINF